MADTEMKYFAKLGLDSSEFMKGLSQSSQGLLAFARDVTVTMQMALMIFDRVIAQVRKAGEMAMELRDLSYTTGITTDQLQRLKYAAVLSGTSFYDVTTVLQKLTLTMDEATDTASEASRAFARIGVDPDGKTTKQVFDETTAALYNMKDETARNSVAMDIYGKSWKNLIPYIQTYIDKKAEIDDTPIISEKELDDLAEANIAWQKRIDLFTIYTNRVIAWAENKDNPYSDKAAQEAYAKRNKPGEAWNTFFNIGFPSGAGGREGEIIPDTPAQSNAIIELTDKFAGLTDQEIELLMTSDDLRVAIRDQAKALESGDKGAYDKACARVALLTNKYYELIEAMRLAQITATDTAAAIGAGWTGETVVGTEGSMMQEFLAREMSLGTSYAQALQNWAQGTPTPAGPTPGTIAALTAGATGTLSSVSTSSISNTGGSVVVNQTNNIVNPKGTPAENAAAVKQANRQVGTALQVGGI